MSADNRICIMQIYTGQWAVWHGSGSAEYYEAPEGSALFMTEEEAIDYAHAEHDRIELVEYGVQKISHAEQMDALCYAIKDLGERLVRLRTTDKQWNFKEGDDF